MILSQVFAPKAININLESTDKDEVLEELVEGFVSVVPDVSRSAVLSALVERESKLSTGIGHGVAVPHGVCDGFSGVKGFVGVSRAGIDFNSLDNVPVQVIFMVISGRDDCEYHLQVIKRLAQILKEPAFLESILSKTNPQDVYDSLVRFEEMVTATA